MSAALHNSTRPSLGKLVLVLVTISLGLWTSACRCGSAPSPVDEGPVGAEPRAEPNERAPIQAKPPARPRQRLVVATASELAELDLEPVEELDLAMSENDGHERPLLEFEAAPAPALAGAGESEGGEPAREPGSAPQLANPRCAGLDLHDVAKRAPRLVTLRISGCQAAVHAGLSAFGEGLKSLELVDLELDAVTIARLSQLHGLERLTLTRVHAEPDALKPLGRKISPSAVSLRELRKDSPVAELFGILSGVRELRVVGPWVTHDTMIQIGKSKELEHLAIIDTEIGNYSLHQIKPLDQLRRLEWAGPGFNDSSALFLKELPLEELVCDCPRLGDRGLRQLYLLKNLRVLEIVRSGASSAGLVHLLPLQQLVDLTLRYIDLDAEGFAALAGLPELSRLVLGPGELLDPKATGLGELTALRELIIELSGFGDAAAPQLASLTGLERLDLGETRISDTGLEHLAPLTRLTQLELHHTRVTKHGLEHLAGMRSLVTLELDHTDLVDEGLAHLASLSSLRTLRLDNTLITDAGLPHLVGLTQLERLNLANTVVTREGLAPLASLPALRAVNLAGTRAAE